MDKVKSEKDLIGQSMFLFLTHWNNEDSRYCKYIALKSTRRRDTDDKNGDRNTKKKRKIIKVSFKGKKIAPALLRIHSGILRSSSIPWFWWAWLAPTESSKSFISFCRATILEMACGVEQKKWVRVDVNAPIRWLTSSRCCSATIALHLQASQAFLACDKSSSSKTTLDWWCAASSRNFSN